MEVHHCESKSMRKKLILYGGGSFAAEVSEVARILGFDIIGYVDEFRTKCSLNYLGGPDELEKLLTDKVYVFPSFGAVDRKSLGIRTLKLNSLKKFEVPNLISPYAIVSDNVKFGGGVFVAHGSVLNSGCYIGKFCIINTLSIVGHDCKIMHNSIIAGKVFIGGSTEVGPRSLVGPGANVLQSLNIGSDTIISFGACVARNVASGKTVAPILSKVL